MDRLIGNPCDEFVIPYLDDIIIFSKSEKDHGQHFLDVLSRIKENGVVLKKKKCSLFKDEIKILGNIVFKGYFKPDLAKIDTIQKYPFPDTLKSLRSFWA
jgi:hypothetical protein